jgi:RND superfamily putative drug exporter
MDSGRRPQEGGRGPALLAPVAGLVTRRPRTLVVIWLLIMSGLALLGNGLDEKVSARTVYVAGGPAERAHEIAVREFGGEDALVLMLRGPAATLDRQGSELVDRLQGLPQTRVLSPWNARGAIDGLRPSPEVAALLISVGESSAPAASGDTVSIVRETVEETVSSPVRVSLAGGPAVVESLRDAIAKAAAFGERLAIPVLLIVLLLVCRSLLAAALPVVIGGFVAGATRGVLDLLAGTVTIDSIALGTAGMLGLALGVDYSLLIVARFREEIERDGDIERAVRTTVMRTGRAILPAGCGLLLALLAALLLIPGSFIGSVALAGISATVLSVLSAMLLAPAALTLLGTHLNRWSLPRRRQSGSLVMGWSHRWSRRPGVVLGMLFVLMLCGAWAFALQTNVGVASLLPPDDPGRQAQEEIERELGPGWVAPFEIVMAGGDRPVTTPRRLEALAAFQRRVERDPGVKAMAGFAALASATDALGAVEGDLARQERGARRLNRGLAGVQDGAAASANGFLLAADGAARLGAVTGAARSGSGRLAHGLRRSSAGSTRLSDGLGEASAGSGKLTRATSRTSSGASRLAAEVASAQQQSDEAAASGGPLRNALHSGERSLEAMPLPAAEDQLAAAWQALRQMSVGRGDPHYAAASAAVREASKGLTGIDPESDEGDPSAGVAAGVADALGQFELALYLAERQQKSQRRAGQGVEKLADASAQLDRGLERLLVSSRRVSAGVARLSQRGGELPPGLRRLTAGAEQLLSGLGAAESGAGDLAGGLDEGAGRSRGLTAAIGRLHSATEQEPRSDLASRSPGLFRSGYFYLAGLDGSRPERRNQAGFLVNIAQGGSAARMLVIPSDDQASTGAAATGDRLTADAARLARETDAEVVVGGLSPSLVELDTALRDQTPLARLVLSLVTILILLPVTRSLMLPIIAALFNLLTVSATFGVLSLLFNGSLLGGPGFVDSSVIPATVVLTFGLAIDYEVFILARIREEYVRTGSTSAAIANGLAKTAPVISGAAVIMIAVFLAFAISSLLILRNLGVALAIGVVIDAFLIRFVLLPAAMRALGDRCWWLPGWLDRIMPGARPPAMRAVEA